MRRTVVRRALLRVLLEEAEFDGDAEERWPVLIDHPPELYEPTRTVTGHLYTCRASYWLREE